VGVTARAGPGVLSASSSGCCSWWQQGDRGRVSSTRQRHSTETVPGGPWPPSALPLTWLPVCKKLCSSPSCSRGLWEERSDGAPGPPRGQRSHSRFFRVACFDPTRNFQQQQERACLEANEGEHEGE
jgi:hypothetical protein